MSTPSKESQAYLQACLKAERSALDLAMQQLKESQEECKRLLQRAAPCKTEKRALAADDVFARLRAAVGGFPPLHEYVCMSAEQRQRAVEQMFASARNEEWEVMSNSSE